jgi:hypothetical protein
LGKRVHAGSIGLTESSLWKTRGDSLRFLTGVKVTEYLKGYEITRKVRSNQNDSIGTKKINLNNHIKIQK